ncbi:MAG: hypothetical protein GY808_11965, partial [Gammaproteobacteria bacterium]|nr:hypothetical protein [Gammaproteobacteria bacterium]
MKKSKIFILGYRKQCYIKVFILYLLIALACLLIFTFFTNDAPNTLCNQTIEFRETGAIKNFPKIENYVSGSTNAVYVQDNYLFLGIGVTFAIFDLVSIHDIEPVSQILLPGKVKDISIVGELAYISGDWNGLKIIDISNIENPVIVACWGDDTKINHVHITNNYAFMLTEDGYVSIADIEINNELTEVYFYEPRTLTQFNLFPKPRLIRPQPIIVGDIAASGEYLYTAENMMGTDVFYNGRLRIINTTNPSNLKLVTTYSMPLNTGATQIMLDTDYIYVSADGFVDHQLTVLLNITDPNNPIEIAQFEMEQLVAAENSRAYFVEGSNLSVWDISNPKSISELGVLRLPVSQTATIEQVYVYENTIYMALGREGLFVIDVSNPSLPNIVNVITFPLLWKNLDIDGDLAYLVADNFEINDVSNSDKITMLSILENLSAIDIEILNRIAYIAVGENGLILVNVSDPANSQVIETLTQSSAYRVATDKDHIIILDQEGKVNIIEPSTFNIISTFSDQSVDYYDIAVLDNFVYLLGEDDGVVGVWILDISNPTNPLLVGLYDDSEIFLRIDADQGYAYIAKDSEILVLDLQNPTSPINFGTYP